MTEQWKPVVGYEKLYIVSDHGRVCSSRGVIMKLSSKGGRCSVVLCRNGIKKTHQVHHLVLEAHVGPRPPGMNGLHWDDDPANNHLTNLRWGTESENRHDAVRNGKHANASKTHCKRKHEFTPENTLMYRGKRFCRECGRERRVNPTAA